MNISKSYSLFLLRIDEFDVIPANVADGSLDSLPSFSETLAAIGKLKKSKACGPDGIEAELLTSLDLTDVRSFA